MGYVKAPLQLQCKTFQNIIRTDHSTIFFVGGADVTESFYSKKTFKLDLNAMKVHRLDNIDEGNSKAALIRGGDKLFLIGGQKDADNYTDNVTFLDITDVKNKWKKA